MIIRLSIIKKKAQIKKDINFIFHRDFYWDIFLVKKFARKNSLQIPDFWNLQGNFPWNLFLQGIFHGIFPCEFQKSGICREFFHEIWFYKEFSMEFFLVNFKNPEFTGKFSLQILDLKNSQGKTPCGFRIFEIHRENFPVNFSAKNSTRNFSLRFFYEKNFTGNFFFTRKILQGIFFPLNSVWFSCKIRAYSGFHKIRFGDVSLIYSFWEEW